MNTTEDEDVYGSYKDLSSLLEQKKFQKRDSLLGTHLPHFIISSTNGFSTIDGKIDCAESYEGFPYYSSVAVPFGDPVVFKEENLNGIDPVTKFLHDKRRWEYKKHSIITESLRPNVRQVKATKSKCIKKVYEGTLKLAQHLDNDPDPNYMGTYNWYYTGGCLDKVFHNDSYSLISVRESLPGAAIVTPLHFLNGDLAPLESQSLLLQTNRNETVFQTIVNKDYIVTRQKKALTLFKYNDKTEYGFRQIHQSSENEYSITSASVNSDNSGEYCSLTTFHTVKIWSPELKNKCLIEGIINKYCENTCDHWGLVKYISKNNILTAMRNSISIKDTRQDLHKNANVWNIQYNNNMNCDNISEIVVSNNDCHVVYIATKHRILKLDLRVGFSKNWTHMMESYPLYGSFCNDFINGNEMLIFGSQNINEIFCILPDMQVMPKILPSPNETLLKSKLNGLCLNPSVSKRFNFSMAGLTSIIHDKNIYVFRSTSLGDIFYQKMLFSGCTEFDESEFNKEILDKWINNKPNWEERCSNSVENLTAKSLKITNIIDHSNLFNFLLKGNSKFLKKSRRKVTKITDNENYETWKMSKRRMLSSEDPLSSCLLDAWDIDTEDEWSYKKINKSKMFDKGDNNTDVVESWLDQCMNRNPEVDMGKSPNQDFSSENINLTKPSTSKSTSFSRPISDANLFFDDVQNLSVNNLSSNNLQSGIRTLSNKKKVNSKSSCKPRFSSGF